MRAGGKGAGLVASTRTENGTMSRTQHSFSFVGGYGSKHQSSTPSPSPVQADFVQHGEHGHVGLARAGGRAHQHVLQAGRQAEVSNASDVHASSLSAGGCACWTMPECSSIALLAAQRQPRQPPRPSGHGFAQWPLLQPPTLHAHL